MPQFKYKPNGFARESFSLAADEYTGDNETQLLQEALGKACRFAIGETVGRREPSKEVTVRISDPARRGAMRDISLGRIYEIK